MLGFAFIISLLIALYSVCADVTVCGPKQECECFSGDAHVSMKCEHIGSSLAEICSFIGNTTDKNVTKLTATDLSVGKVSKEMLVGCGSLTKLILTNDGIVLFEGDTFEDIQNLTILDLGNNVLEIYNSQNLYRFPQKLRVLKLNGNRDSSTRDTSYPDINSTTIEVLFLNGINGKGFPVSYSRLKALRSLTLSGHIGRCNLTYLTNTTFENVSTLDFLNISFCSIKFVEAGTFGALPSLEVLDISRNMNMGFSLLSNVSYGLQFTNVKYLNYSKMHSTFGTGVSVRLKDVCFLHNTSLIELSIDSNRVDIFETNVPILAPTSLRVLSARDNLFSFGLYLLQLGCIPNGAEYYGSLQNNFHNPLIYFSEKGMTNDNIDSVASNCPYMEDDFLKKVSKSYPHCPFFEQKHPKFVLPAAPKAMKKIVLNDCNMEYEIPPFNISGIEHNLKYIDLSGNVLHSWKGPILGPFNNVKYLDLSRNYCDQISSQFFTTFPSLETLHLDQNFIGLILANDEVGTYVFRPLRYLKTLTMSANKITSIPTELLTNNTDLEVLDLSLNNIESWTIDTGSLKNLTHINISFNFITYLPSQLTNHLDDVSVRREANFTVDMSNNTIRYNCSEQYFLKWLVAHKENMIGFDAYHFEGKDNEAVSADKFVKIVNNMSEYCKERPKILLPALLVLSIFAVVCLIALVVSNRKVIRHRFAKFRDPPRNYKASRFKAFISFADEDRYFVYDVLAERLETDYELPCCLHERDFKAGTDIRRNIAEGIQDSEYVIVVLSNGYLTGDWCKVEFEFAVEEISNYKRPQNSLILVVTERMNDQDLRNNNTIKSWYDKHTRLDYTEGEEFWTRLSAALNVIPNRRDYGSFNTERGQLPVTDYNQDGEENTALLQKSC